MSDNRKFLFGAMIFSGLLNVTISLLVGYLLVGTSDVVYLYPSEKDWSATTIVGDLIVSTIILAIILTYLIQSATHKNLLANRVQYLNKRTLLFLLPEKTFRLGVILGLISATCFAMPVSFILDALKLFKLESSDYIVLRASYTCLLATGLSAAVVLKTLENKPKVAEVVS